MITASVETPSVMPPRRKQYVRKLLKKEQEEEFLSLKNCFLHLIHCPYVFEYLYIEVA